jgi:hypothetical protein
MKEAGAWIDNCIQHTGAEPPEQDRSGFFFGASKDMGVSTGKLRPDNPTYVGFLMARNPPEPEEKRERIAEWVLMNWMNHLDPNIIGIRRLDEDKSGRVVPMIHIAIPLEYKRRELAQVLGIAPIEDEQNAPRVNVISSLGWHEPHSYIRVPADVVVSQVLDLLRAQLLEPEEINDHTIQVPQDAVEEFVRANQRNHREENARLRTAVQQALAMRNAAIEPHQIQILTHKETREKWVSARPNHPWRGNRPVNIGVRIACGIS